MSIIAKWPIRTVLSGAGPGLDDPVTAPKPLSLDTLAQAIIRSRNLRVQAETVVAQVEEATTRTMAALEQQKREAVRALDEARKVEREDVGRLVAECKELGIKPEDLVS